MKIFKLKDISKFIKNGVTIKQNISSKEGIPITRIETISKGIVDFNKLGYADIFELEKYRDWLLQKGDILISHINSEKHLGKSAIFLDNDINIIHGMNLLCIRAIDNIVFPEYLQLFFKTNQYKKQIKKIMKKSVNQASFSVNDFKEILITLPELDIQEKIIKKVKVLEFFLENCKLKLKLLSELNKSLFTKFNKNGIEKQLNDVADIIMGQSPSSQSYNKDKKGLPFYQGKTEFSDIYIKDPTVYCNSPIKVVEENDILMSVRAPVGDVNIATQKSCIGRGLASIKPKKIDYLYLFYLLKEQKSKIEKIGVGSTFKAINKNNISTLKISIVEKDKQNKIRNYLSSIEKLKFEIKKSIETSQNLYDSLISKYFDN